MILRTPSPCRNGLLSHILDFANFRSLFYDTSHLRLPRVFFLIVCPYTVLAKLNYCNWKMHRIFGILALLSRPVVDQVYGSSPKWTFIFFPRVNYAKYAFMWRNRYIWTLTMRFGHAIFKTVVCRPGRGRLKARHFLNDFSVWVTGFISTQCRRRLFDFVYRTSSRRHKPKDLTTMVINTTVVLKKTINVS